MKCKSWSNKINNFVVRRLKSLKSNGQPQQQQQQLLTTTAAAAAAAATTTIVETQPPQQQQQYLSTCCTMPAMPKEKATAVSLSESNFSELKLKELAASTADVVVAASATTAVTAATGAMATTATTNRLQQTVQQQPHHHHHQQHQQQAQLRSTCGCGNATAIDLSGGTHRSSKYMTNGHSSPLAAAVAGDCLAQVGGTASPRRGIAAIGGGSSNISSCSSNSNSNNNNNNNNINTSCCRARYQPTNGNNNTSTSNVATTAAGATSTTAAVTAAPAAVTPPKKSPKDFIFGKYIGEGSFSIVYLAVDVNTKREYAIKVCEKRQILREHKQEYIRREREVMHMLTNVPGFVNLSCTFQDSRSLYFVMTYAKNGDLLPYINKVGSFDVDCTRHYAAELVLACEEMHRRNVVHRDLKPENILLDENMHTLIADFGSTKILSAEERATANAALAAGIAAAATTRATTTAATSGSSRTNSEGSDKSNLDVDDDEDDEEDSGSSNDTGASGDDVDSPRSRRQHQPRYHRGRKGSFVGTAQYVSPEVLQNGPITPAVDLWALGCIVYQMISGLPPFRGSNDFVIFKEVIACNLDFPQGFDKDAEDLVRQLLRVNPAERLGALDASGHYDSIRSHPFFAGVDFERVRQQMPPPIYPYLPGLPKEDNDGFRSHYRVPENLEPGLDDKQLTRLLGMELGCGVEVENNKTVATKTTTTAATASSMSSKTAAKNSFDLSDAEKHKRLEQQKSDKWHAFADEEVILKKGLINKRKGLFARKRMLLLTTGPRLIYIDPVQMIKKGEIPWSPELRAEAKNFKIFFVHTPNRTYYLDDPEGYSLEWVDAIEKMHLLTYKANKTSASATLATASGPPSTASAPVLTSHSSSTPSTLSTITRKTSSLLATPLAAMKTASN